MHGCQHSIHACSWQDDVSGKSNLGFPYPAIWGRVNHSLNMVIAFIALQDSVEVLIRCMGDVRMISKSL